VRLNTRGRQGLSRSETRNLSQKVSLASDARASLHQPMLKVLLPHEIAKTCYLIVALLYRAVGRLPLQPIWENEIDPVDEPEEYPDIVLTPEECRAVGLPPDPEWEERQKREGEGLRDLLFLGGPTGGCPNSGHNGRL
jgi:hypothetical protein